MRTTNSEGYASEPTKDLEDTTDTKDNMEFDEPVDELPEYKVTQDLEDSEENETVEDNELNGDNTGDDEEEELYNLLPKGWDDVGWDGGERTPDSQDEVNAVLDGYYVKKYERDLRRSEEERRRLEKELKEKRQYEEDFEEDEIFEEDEEIDALDEDDPNYLKKRIALWSGIGTIFVLILAISGYFLFNKEPANLSEMQAKVNRLYTSEAKIDIKNSVSLDTLESYYLSLKGISEEERKSNTAVGIEHELDTIGYFISDNAMVEEFLDTKYDLASASLRENIEKIKENLNKYTVSGLSLTVKDKCTKIESELNEYEGLKAELSGITDINIFVPANYENRVNAITHEGNKKEVKIIFDKLCKDKTEQEAIKKAEELAVQEAQKQAEALKEKAEAEKARLQKELDKTKQQLQEQIEAGKELLENQNNSSDGGEQDSGYYYYEESEGEEE